MADITKVPESSTGSQERIRIKNVYGGVTLSGSIVSFDFKTGDFSALLDVQPKGSVALYFIKVKDSVYGNTFLDTIYSETWELR